MSRGSALSIASGMIQRHPAAIIVLLALAASGTSIVNGFAFDDVHILVDDTRLHSLRDIGGAFTNPYWPEAAGGALYRPLTSIVFMLQWSVGGGSPLPFHVVSIIVSVAVALAVYRFALEIADRRVALLAASLFAVHPLHVEVVANVVGQAELFAALFALLSVTRYLRTRRKESIQKSDVAAVSGLFALALMFKEHVVVLPAVIVVFEAVLGGRRRFVDSGWRRIAPLVAALALVSVLFVVVRTIVIGSVHGAGTSPIFAGEGYAARLYTMLNVMQEWIRLFMWPANLSADYSPSRIEIASELAPSMVPGLMVIVAMPFIAFAFRRTQPLVTIAVAWAAITLLIPSNLLVLTGFVLAERALFLPSVGVVLLVAFAIEQVRSAAIREGSVNASRVIAATALLLISLGIIRSSSRNAVWRDNGTLFHQTVLDAPQSGRAHMMLSQHLRDRGDGMGSMREAALAVQTGSQKDPQLFAFAADIFQMGGRCQTASPLYSQSLALSPDQPQVRVNAVICLLRNGRFAEARQVADGGLNREPSDQRLRHLAVLSDSLRTLRR